MSRARRELRRHGPLVELRRYQGNRWVVVGRVLRLPGTEECVLVGDQSGRRYPGVDAALDELDLQFERAMAGQP